jgi:hypothetical protein
MFLGRESYLIGKAYRSGERIGCLVLFTPNEATYSVRICGVWTVSPLTLCELSSRIICLQLITTLQKIDMRYNEPWSHRLHLILSLVLTGGGLFGFAQLVMSVNGL